MDLSPEIKTLMWEIIGKRAPTPANIARGNQWRKAGEYEHQERYDCICGGWYLIRNDENASISAHFAGCLRIAPVRTKEMAAACRRDYMHKIAGTANADGPQILGVAHGFLAEEPFFVVSVPIEQLGREYGEAMLRLAYEALRSMML